MQHLKNQQKNLHKALNSDIIKIYTLHRDYIMDCLLLNASGLPVSVLPLSIIDWQEAIKYMVLEKADVIQWHEDWIVNSSNWSTMVPSVLMLREYMKPKGTVRFSRTALYYRDNGECQYCGTPLTIKSATIDHVLPASKGGKTSWDNCSIACEKCNFTKGNNEKIRPRMKPYKPDYFELVNKRKKFDFNVKHKEWLKYIM